ncbi:MAG: response regulator [Alphaproteobacteria bacterium]|nr:response regulator [Alphaproteobacteria bacterium]
MAEAALTRNEAEGFQPTALSVMLVEDDAFALGLERRILERLGIRNIITAGDGEEALAFLQTGLLHFDVIMSDLRMPKLDGIELLKRVRADWPEIPYVLLTADRTETSVLSAQGLGVDAYVTKPFSPSQLLRTLKVIFERRDPTGLSVWQRSDEYRLMHTTGHQDLLRLYELWDERRRGRAMPESNDFLPLESSPLAVIEQNLLLVEIVDGGRMRFEKAGKTVEENMGLKLEGDYLDRQPAWFRRHIEGGIRSMIRTRRPSYQNVKTILDFRVMNLQRLVLPVAEGHRGIAYALCVTVRN